MSGGPEHSERVFVVDSALRGIRLGEFLEQQLPRVHRLALRRHLGSGQVRINGDTVLSDRRLRVGDVVQVAAMQEDAVVLRTRSQRPVRAPLEVLFESDTAVVVAKPAGVPTVPDRAGRERGVHGELAALRPDADLRIVHRLDRETSGCLLLANGLSAARHFDAALRERALQKHYVALVHGVVRPGEFEINRFLGPDSRRPGKVVAAAVQKKGFREAQTLVQRRIAFEAHSFVDLWPKTGRGHQLRVHLASKGHPIVGDRDYGGHPLLLSQIKRGYKARPGQQERPLIARSCLHAFGLRFSDLDGRDVAVECPIPDDLQLALQKLEHFATPQS
ncbi:MAG: RluA family pseudouridine synthase [bacterium]|nr:RluA family pseudouridine synthase [bacterium]